MAEKIDELDLNIIRALQKNARQSYRELAEKLNVAEGTIYNRITKLQEQKIIRRFMVDVDYAKLGFELVALIGITVEGGHLPEIETKLAKEPNVSAVYDVTGEYDALVVVKVHNSQELNDLVKKVLATPKIQRTNTMVVLNVVKEQHNIDL